MNLDGSSSPLDDSLTNIQWLGKMNTSSLEPHLANDSAEKESIDQKPQELPVSF